MLYSLRGTIIKKGDDHVVIESGGMGFKIAASLETLNALTQAGETAQVYCHLYVREDRLDLFGFATEYELALFEHLIGVSGVGPKTALGILSVADTEHIEAAIAAGKADLLAKAPGIGSKTAQRIVLELKNKVAPPKSDAALGRLEVNAQVEDALTSLGYSRAQARQALKHVPAEIKGVEARLREALQALKK